jgi:hypothetical protein
MAQLWSVRCQPRPLWSVDEVDWFRVRHQDWIDSWTQGYLSSASGDGAPQPDAEHLAMPYVLEVSAEGDGAILLLNPLVVTPEGEWEAWSFANWYPGAVRYRSFWELMKRRYESFWSDENEEP